MPSAIVGGAAGAITGCVCAVVAAAGASGWIFIGGSVGIITLGFLSHRAHVIE
jgi:hypothetical protein